MNNALRILSIFLLMTVSTQAETFDITGEIPAINEVVIEDFGLNSGLPGSAFSLGTSTPVARVIISNNDSEGFYVNFSSQNSGKLISTNDELKQIGYTVSTIPDPSAGGILGTSDPTPLANRSLVTDAQLVFNGSIQRATINKAYILSISPSEPVSNPDHFYRDQVTVTIHNL